jgi:hypothetical protein
LSTRTRPSARPWDAAEHADHSRVISLTINAKDQVVAATVVDQVPEGE